MSGNADSALVRSPPYVLKFDVRSGLLQEVRKNDRVFPFKEGPQLVAYRRVQRQFERIAASSRLIAFRAFDNPSDQILATATYDGPLRRVSWSRDGDALAMSYELAYEGAADIFGVGFRVPEDQVLSKRWVGMGPYRVWQNRQEGGVFDLHETTYNDAIPGQTYAYPEFKGYFRDWRWLALQTKGGDVIIENASNVPYFGLYKPQGGVQPILDLPDVGVAFLSVVPAMGTKFTLPDVLGPQSMTPTLSGTQTARVTFRFEAPKRQ
jgi:hypothetical protein